MEAFLHLTDGVYAVSLFLRIKFLFLENNFFSLSPPLSFTTVVIQTEQAQVSCVHVQFV